MPYVEVSAKTGENVEEMIYSVIDMHIEKASEPILQQKE